MTPHELADLTARLHTLRHECLQARRQQALAAGQKPPALRNGRPRLFSFPDRVLAAILHQRLELPCRSLAVMFNSNSATIHRAITEIRQLLDQLGVIIAPASTPVAAAGSIRTDNAGSCTSIQTKKAS